MTTHRRPDIPYTDAPRGTCRWCGQYIVFEVGDRCGEVNKRRRWHQACVDTYNESDPREARRRIRKRDRGRCADCCVDTYKVRRELMKLGRGRAKSIRAKGYKPGKSFWELDHIVPLIDGGAHNDENLQTLCTPCHAAKTADEARERARRSREAALANVATTSAQLEEPQATEPPSAPEPASAMRMSRNVKHKSLDELFDDADAVNARVRQVLSERDDTRSSETPTA